MSLPPRPDWLCRSLLEVDFQALARLGRTVVLLDVDNTIALRSSPVPWPPGVEWLRRARQDGYIQRLCLVSNTILGRRRRERVQCIATLLDAGCVCAGWWEAKPSARPFQRALAEARPESAVMVGDQLFTDVAGASRLGIFTVLVEPLGPDGWMTRLTGRRGREMHWRRHWAVPDQYPRSSEKRV